MTVYNRGGGVSVTHTCRKWQSQIALGTPGRRDTELSMWMSYPSRGKGHVAQSPQYERGPHCEDTVHRTLPARKSGVVVSLVRAPQRLLAIIAVRVQPQACMTTHDAQVEWYTHNSTRRVQDYTPCSERCSCCCACTHMQTSIRHPGSKSMSKCLPCPSSTPWCR